MRQLTALLLAPFSLLYGLGVSLWKSLYRLGVLRSVRFDIPIIVVGNLSVGGTGKTPHVDYILAFLQKYYKVGSLSRGYKRESKGFQWVYPNSTAAEVGDEALQIKRRHPEAIVAVAADRAFAIPKMLGAHPDIKTIVLDDAYQHLAVEGSTYMLLSTFQKPFFEDYLLPSGRLREGRFAYQRARLIVVTKCPINITVAQRQAYIEKIKPRSYQRVFFSRYEYGKPYFLFGNEYQILPHQLAQMEVILLCGIANTEYLEDYLAENCKKAHLLDFPDHHHFSRADIERTAVAFEELENPYKVIITTEKDAMRLQAHRKLIEKEELPIFVLPIEVRFCFEEEPAFQEALQEELLNFKVRPAG